MTLEVKKSILPLFILCTAVSKYTATEQGKRPFYDMQHISKAIHILWLYNFFEYQLQLTLIQSHMTG